MTATRTASLGPADRGSAPVNSRGTPSARPAAIELLRKLLRGIGFILLPPNGLEWFRVNRNSRIESQRVRPGRYGDRAGPALGITGILLQEWRLQDVLPRVKQRVARPNC